MQYLSNLEVTLPAMFAGREVLRHLLDKDELGLANLLDLAVEDDLRSGGAADSLEPVGSRP